MKIKTFAILLFSIILLSSIVAAKPKILELTDDVKGIEGECQDAGFDFAIVKFEWFDGSGYVQEGDARFPFVVTVTGDQYEANWTSSPAVQGVIRKIKDDRTVFPGGTEGTVPGMATTNPQGVPIVKAISHLTFCGRGDIPPPPPRDTPEFSTTTLAIAVLGVSLGIVALRRKD